MCVRHIIYSNTMFSGVLSIQNVTDLYGNMLHTPMRYMNLYKKSPSISLGQYKYFSLYVVCRVPFIVF